MSLTEQQRQRLCRWVEDHLSMADCRVENLLGGGNSNLTLALRTQHRSLVLRTPPENTISATAHKGIAREARVMAALHGHIRVPLVEAFCEDTDIIGRPFLVIERIDGVSITDQLPTNYPQTAQSVNELGQQLTDELAKLHNIDPAAVGLSDFGNPTDFLSRNIDRWLHIRSQEAVRDLPDIERLGLWLRAHLPAISSPSLTHGDFHIDNTLCSPNRPVLEAIIDWELATLGDPLTDLGLFLMFWGPRSEDPPAFRHIQAVSRVNGALSRQQLAAHWSSLTGRSISELSFYLCFAFWRLACIVEGAWILQATGKVDTAYARGLEYDVPALLREAHRASQGDW